MAFAGAAHRFREIWTSIGLLAASGCVTPVEPTNMPGLMSAMLEFTDRHIQARIADRHLQFRASRFLTT